MKPLLVFAMEQEAQGIFDGYDVLHTQIGKVNGVYHLTKSILSNKPEIVINLGTAGSRKHAGGSVINPTCFIQRDMDVRPLGFEFGQTPFSNDPIELEYGERSASFIGGVCGTGDNFDVSDRAEDYDVVDMEAYALALVCKRENVPFMCLKYVSDGADDGAEQDFESALLKAAHALHDALEIVLKER